MAKSTPPPGSPKAIRKGCTCCPDKNHNGDGEMIRGVPIFTISYSCHVHKHELDDYG